MQKQQDLAWGFAFKISKTDTKVTESWKWCNTRVMMSTYFSCVVHNYFFVSPEGLVSNQQHDNTTPRSPTTSESYVWEMWTTQLKYVDIITLALHHFHDSVTLVSVLLILNANPHARSCCFCMLPVSFSLHYGIHYLRGTQTHNWSLVLSKLFWQ